MKLVTIRGDLLAIYFHDSEVLRKSRRPYVLVLHLEYRGKRQDFAVPIRSNIPAAAPKNQYFALPPRPQTKPRNHHGIHYIKMFPISRQYLVRYRTAGNPYAELIESIIDKNKKKIISGCQMYLNKYEQGIRPAYSTDIDFLLEQLQKEKKD